MASASSSTRGKCPICGRPTVPEYRPFCSRRCADVDLARWLSGAYVIPEPGESEDTTPAPMDAENSEAESERRSGSGPNPKK
jgi:endogenous inhibitor of DNA gyrase (YacG/DUF329 family)